MPPKGRAVRGRKSTRGKKAGMGVKKPKVPSALVSDDEGEEETQPVEDENIAVQCDKDSLLKAPSIDIEQDISKLEAPTFTTIDRGPPEPLHNNTKLRWDYKVNLIGEKVVNPLLHCCEKCTLPILIYGRMIPCKHVFCLDCGKAAETSCPRCLDKVTRVEQCNLGTVYMCMYGGSRHGHNGCRRTYLSQRDLQAHINHRHLRSSASESSSHHKTSPKYDQAKTSRDPRGQTISQATLAMQQLMEKHQVSKSSSSTKTHSASTTPPLAPPSTTTHTYSTPIPVMSTRTNLITIPIQDSSAQIATTTKYVPYTSAPPIAGMKTISQAPIVATAQAYQIQMTNPYSQPPPQHPPVSYPTIPPTTYSSSLSSSQLLSFSQPPPTHLTHMPPPLMHNQAVAIPHIYNAPPPAVQRPGIGLPPARAPAPRQQYQSGAQYEEVPVGSPPYQWQGSGPPPRGTSSSRSYRPHFYR